MRRRTAWYETRRARAEPTPVRPRRPVPPCESSRPGTRGIGRARIRSFRAPTSPGPSRDAACPPGRKARRLPRDDWPRRLVAPWWKVRQMSEAWSAPLPWQAREEGLLVALPHLPSTLLVPRLNRGVHLFRDFSFLSALCRAPQSKVNRRDAAMRLGVLRSILDEGLQERRSALVISLVRRQESELIADADFFRPQPIGLLQ